MSAKNGAVYPGNLGRNRTSWIQERGEGAHFLLAARDQTSNFNHGVDGGVETGGFNIDEGEDGVV
jgi:hypothetical protein